MRFVPDRAQEEIGVDVYDGVDLLGPVPSNEVDVPYVFDDEPHAFLVTIGSSRDAIKTHYHRVDQFQYVRAGSGRIVPHHVVTGAVHYTDAYTPYGPVAPGPEGLAYLTLRGLVDNGAFYMPQSRADLKEQLAASPRPPRSRRNVTVELDGVASAPGWTDLVLHDDELRIAVVDVPPGGRAETPVAAGGGAYVVVVRGDAEHDVGSQGTGSLVWLDRGESLELSSADGARLGLLQFPTPAY